MSTAPTTAAPLPASRHRAGGRPGVGPVPGSSPARTRLRITRRGRAVLAAVLAAPLVLGTAAAMLNGGDAVATSSSSAAEFSFVEVKEGQSLWSLAETIAPQSDPREVISALVRLNGLPSADVQPGERLAIPFEYLR